MKPAAIGANPLDAIVPQDGNKTRKVSKVRKVAVAGKVASPRKAVESEPTPATARTAQAIKATFNLPPPLVDEARAAVVALSAPPLRLTLAALVEKALRAELDRLEKDYNRGKPFPPLAEKLRGGRPIGS
jgi:hypothetical protein